MTLDEVKALDHTYYMNTFGDRTPVLFQKGKGMCLYDDTGKHYYDFLAGIAVNALGHCHPVLVDRMKTQMETLIHTSSLYYIENQAKLAQRLIEQSAFDRAFFCNSGAEANEGAIKLAKIYHYKKGNGHKNEIITLQKSFHGRTLATVAATGQEKYQKPYKPLTPGFIHIPINDIQALQGAVNENTAAILIELVQGESGVHPCDHEFVGEIRKICDEQDILMIADEVQTGIGRCGNLFAYQNFGIEPDVITLAKALGGGIPIGAVLAKEFVSSAFTPGDHGTTFGGNPLSCAAGLAVLDIIEEEGLINRCRKYGSYLKNELLKLKNKTGKMKEIRGMGLLIGIEFVSPCAPEVYNSLFEQGFLVSKIGESTLRLAPPLIVEQKEIDLFLAALESSLSL